MTCNWRPVHVMNVEHFFWRFLMVTWTYDVGKNQTQRATLNQHVLVICYYSIRNIFDGWLLFRNLMVINNTFCNFLPKNYLLLSFRWFHNLTFTFRVRENTFSKSHTVLKNNFFQWFWCLPLSFKLSTRKSNCRIIAKLFLIFCNAFHISINILHQNKHT